MFPISITLNVTNAEQLNALTACVAGSPALQNISGNSKVTTAKKSDAATTSAATTTTAAATVAQESKASNSALADPVAILDKDALGVATKNAIAKVGREKVIELISSYGVAKGSEVAADKRAEFDAKLLALAA